MADKLKDKKDTYEGSFAVLEGITDSLNKDEIGIDDLLEKTREALEAARRCMDILNHQRGEFQKLEAEFANLIEDSAAETGGGDDSPDDGDDG